MQRIRFTIFITLLSALSAPAFGKATTQLDNGDFLTVIDATAGGAFSTEPHDFTYFSFEDQDVVALTDAEAAESSEWDIAFKRNEIRLNGGGSGPSNVRGFDLNSAEEVVAEGVFDALTATDIPGSDAFSTDGPAYVLGEWYNYDSTTHFLSTRYHVYIIDTGAGFYKMQLLSYYREVEGSPVSGFITFRWRPLTAEPGTAIQSSSWGQLKARLWDSN